MRVRTVVGKRIELHLSATGGIHFPARLLHLGSGHPDQARQGAGFGNGGQDQARGTGKKEREPYRGIYA